MSKKNTTPLERFTRMMFSRVIERLVVAIGHQDLSFSQVAALHIVDREKIITIQDLAGRLNLSLSATSRFVDDLVKRDFLTRIEDELNRRSKLLSLTGHGQEFMDHLSVERVKIVKDTIKTLPDLKKFLSALAGDKK